MKNFDLSKLNYNLAIVLFMIVFALAINVFFAAVFSRLSSQSQGSDQVYTDNKSIIQDSEVTCPPPITLWEQSK
ncbi:hypothetical protein EVB55_142 [Rhizobium phage RHph_Y68]|uniref:Transmembrane protein n=1 Tax=Rhizobium phage RHph_Y68 TaxID=2509787 RepID=A0A7S5QY91_9CAUD|nr:hypothetical protein PP934_gp142 [Rhizobium phage RHph_Y68]QIG68077.1 hypothetical protein EVB55_142 [Rhizobium phage RHph_Y68]